MKKQKHFLMTPLIAICFLWCNCYAQVTVDSSRRISTYKTNDGEYIKFVSDSRKIKGLETVRISPSGSKVILIERNSWIDSLVTINIFNADGNKIANSKVPNLQDLVVNDDGRFVLYGNNDPLEEIKVSNKFYFFDSNGRLINKEPLIFSSFNPVVKFLPNGIVVLLVNQIEIKPNKKMPESIILLLDNKFEKKGEFKFNDTNEDFVQFGSDFYFDELKNQLKIKKSSIKNGIRKIETLTFDMKANVIERKEGGVR